LSRVDDIVKAGLEQLDYYYEAGDKRPRRKKCDQGGCFKMVGSKVAFCPLHRKKAPSLLLGIYDPDKSTAVSPPPEPVPIRVILKSMSATQIIKKVFELTGETITICVKSKNNVVRHAKAILRRKNFEVSD